MKLHSVRIVYLFFRNANAEKMVQSNNICCMVRFCSGFFFGTLALFSQACGITPVFAVTYLIIEKLENRYKNHEQTLEFNSPTSRCSSDALKKNDNAPKLHYRDKLQTAWLLWLLVLIVSQHSTSEIIQASRPKKRKYNSGKKQYNTVSIAATTT